MTLKEDLRDLAEKLEELERRVDSLETSRDRLLGALAFISFVAPLASSMIWSGLFSWLKTLL